MPERTTQLYSKCTLCGHAAGYGFPEGECPGCDGSGYVPQGQASPCEDHPILDRIARLIDVGEHAADVTFLDGRRLMQIEADELARRDGFADLADMLEYWRRGERLPFRGHMIFWGEG